MTATAGPQHQTVVTADGTFLLCLH